MAHYHVPALGSWAGRLEKGVEIQKKREGERVGCQEGEASRHSGVAGNHSDTELKLSSAGTEGASDNKSE